MRHDALPWLVFVTLFVVGPALLGQPGNALAALAGILALAWALRQRRQF